MPEANIELHGFIFELVGTFKIGEKSPRKYKWTDHKGPHHDHITTMLEFTSEDTAQRRETAYLITVDDGIKYVGEFSNTLRDRWLKVGNYIWHHKDHLIFEALEAGNNVSLWLMKDPMMTMPHGEMINISKAAEHHILKANSAADRFTWNQRNRKSV